MWQLSSRISIFQNFEKNEVKVLAELDGKNKFLRNKALISL